MSLLISCDGSLRRCDVSGRRVIVPVRIEREPSPVWEIAEAIYEPTGHAATELIYTERYWELPRRHCDACASPKLHYFT